MLWNKNICVQESKVLVGSLTCKVLRKQEFPGFGTVVTTRKNDVKFFSSLYSWSTKSEVTSSASFPSVDSPNEEWAGAAGTVSHCSICPCGAAVAGCVLWAGCVQSTAPAPPFPRSQPENPLHRTSCIPVPLHPGFAFQVPVSGTAWQLGELVWLFTLQFVSVHKIHCITAALKKPRAPAHFLAAAQIYWLGVKGPDPQKYQGACFSL